MNTDKIDNGKKNLDQIVKDRRSTRNFSKEIPNEEDLMNILKSCIYAPCGGAELSPEKRKIFVFKQGTENMTKAREIILSQVKKSAKMMNRMLIFLPFLRKKMGTFAKKLKMISENGIPALTDAGYFIVIAEKKGFPPVENQSIAHALENMWLTATDSDIAFQMLTVVGQMSKNDQFMNLLNLKKGDYTLGGCAIGYPQTSVNKPKDFEFEKFIVLMDEV
ncbi:MAG: nitroreductase family protein [Paludibacter sp.]|jgi:nitroreductase|nr:nitroreductase family protein [Paludibacter sp.]